MVARNKLMLINYNFGWPTRPSKTQSVPPSSCAFGLLKAQFLGRLRACHPNSSERPFCKICCIVLPWLHLKRDNPLARASGYVSFWLSGLRWLCLCRMAIWDPPESCGATPRRQFSRSKSGHSGLLLKRIDHLRWRKLYKSRCLHRRRLELVGRWTCYAIWLGRQRC